MATDEHGPKTIAERYSAATQAKRLVPVATHEEFSGSLEFLIASGWVREGIGTALYRLRSEWDVVRRQGGVADAGVHAYLAEARALELRAGECEVAARIAGEAPDPQAAVLVTEAARLRDEAARAAITERLLILIHLKSLTSTRDALGVWALGEAKRCGFRRRSAFARNRAIAKAAGRALEFWLDPLCPKCEGRGYWGGYGSPRVTCPDDKHGGCGGTKNRTLRMGDRPADHELGQRLLAEMDRLCQSVDRAMRRFLSQQGPAVEVGPADRAALQARLADLRSSEAERD